MQERQVTVEGETFPLAEPFHVLATANPVEYEGTYPLPEAQLDRFLLRVSFGYPTTNEEYDVLARRLERQQEEVVLDAVTDAAGLLGLQAAVETVRVDESVGRYCVDLAAATRDHHEVLTGSSPRGSLGLVLTARAFAVLRGRDYVIPEDVKAVARSVLAHRITVRPELWMTDVTGAARRRRRARAGCRPRRPSRRPGGHDRAAMTRWRPTGGLSRCLAVGALGLGSRSRSAMRCWSCSPRRSCCWPPSDSCIGRPRVPTSPPVLDHQWMHEGQGTRSRLLVSDLDGVEHVTRVATPSPFVATHPAHGRLGQLVADGSGRPVLEISPRRWGRRILGHEDVALTSRWAGYRWGPVPLVGNPLQVLPVRAPYDSRAEAPQPLGLVGATARDGSGPAPSSPGSVRSRPGTDCAGSTGGSR